MMKKRLFLQYYHGCSVWDQQRYGDGLAYISQSNKLHSDASKLLKNFKGDVKSKLNEAINFTKDIFIGK